MEWLEKWLAAVLGKFVLKNVSKDPHFHVDFALPEIVIYIGFAFILGVVIFLLYPRLKTVYDFLYWSMVRRVGFKEAWRIATVTKVLTSDK